MMKIKKLLTNEKILAVILLIPYLLLFPPFLKNQIPLGHDIFNHLVNLRIFTDALYQGQFPVRWVEWPIVGQNLPLFSFYQPFLYYLVQVPHLFGLSLADSLIFTLLFLWLVSGFFTYIFLKNLTDNTIASLTGSLVYVFAPYHILDVFVRAAYPEFTALAFIPGLFWSTERYFSTSKRQYAYFISIFIAIILTCHPPTSIMFTLPFGIFIFYLLKHHKVKKVNFYAFILAVLLGIGLSSFFTFPSIFQRVFINSSYLETGLRSFSNNFICFSQLFNPSWGYELSIPGCNDLISFQVGILNWFVILASLIIILRLIINRISHKYKITLILFTSFALFGIFMTLSASGFFWENIPYLSFIQPFRFLSVVIFSCSALAALLFKFLNQKHQIILALSVALSLILIVSYLQPGGYFNKDYYLQDSPNFYINYNNLPTKIFAEYGYTPIFARVTMKFNGETPQIQVLDSDYKLELIKNTFTQKEFNLNLKNPSRILLLIHYFPGWRFYINGNEVNPDYSNSYGYIVLHAQKGTNNVLAKFTDSPIVSLSNTISVISFVIFFSLIFLSLKSRVFNKKGNE